MLPQRIDSGTDWIIQNASASIISLATLELSSMIDNGDGVNYEIVSG